MPMSVEHPAHTRTGRLMRPARRSVETKNHSRFVSFMKLVLPLAALTLIILVLVWPQLGSDDVRFQIGFSALKSNVETEPSMTNPRFYGADSENRPYSVTADLARALSKNGAVVKLQVPKADISLKDGTWLVLTAQSGIYKRDTQNLELDGAVNLFHDSGYEFRAPTAVVDMKAGKVSSDKPVEGQGGFGNIWAQGFYLYNRGRTIYFTGKTRLVLSPTVGDGAIKP